MLKKETWRHFDFLLFGAVLLLCIFGIVMIQSAVAGSPGLANTVRNQIIFVVVGVVIILVLAVINYHTWFSTTKLLYGIILALLIGIYFFGNNLFGSRRWFTFAGISIQPSELAKIVLIITLAGYFASTVDKPHNLKWILTSLGLTLGIMVWIAIQPNLSTTILMLVLWFALVWIAGLKLKYVILLGSVMTVLVGIIFAQFVSVGGSQEQSWIQPYQMRRIINFVSSDEEAAQGEKYNVEQALITIGSGGWFGAGYGSGTQVQLRFLKVRHTDFIFSAMAEEFGFVGTTVVVLLLLFVVFRIVHIARNALDTFGALIAYGVAVLIFFQMAVNIGVNLNLLPVTGLTLPFISSGGSSLLSLVLGIGLVESVAVHSHTLEF
ncbi:MAG TPA: FtsW/RodA/SpoVE family cell cycle protein [Bellilinea sp.]|nr:FtsW/RodA/SpoVE family cell cycle protein [Bellilinea sp.]